MARREWTYDMGSLTDMPASYEQAVRDMIEAGLGWFDENPGTNPTFAEGVPLPRNDDAKNLSAAMVAVEPYCSGAGFSGALHAVLWIHAHSWDVFQTAMRADLVKQN